MKQTPLAKHLTTLALLITMTLPSIANAQPKAETDAEGASEAEPAFEFDARIRPRGELRTGRDFGLPAADLRTGAPGLGDLFTLQSRLGVTAKKGALSGRFLIQHAAIWGSTGGGALTQPPLNIAHAWATYQTSEQLSFTMGRFALSYGDQRVLGAVGWNQNTRSWDGLKATYTPRAGVKADVFAARGSDGFVTGNTSGPSPIFDGDAILVGTYTSLGGLMGSALDTLDVYVLGDLVLEDLANDNENPRQLLTMGALAKGKWGLIDATVEGAYQLGSQCQTGLASPVCSADSDNVSAYFADGELGATVMKAPALRVFVAGSIASGDDPDTDTIESYRHLYPTAHKFLGRTDVVGPRSNVIEARAGASLKAGAFSLRESVHYFQRIQPESERLGVELDTTLGYKISDELTLGAGHGIFIPGPAVSLSSTTPDQLHNWFYIQAVASWGK